MHLRSGPQPVFSAFGKLIIWAASCPGGPRHPYLKQAIIEPGGQWPEHQVEWLSLQTFSSEIAQTGWQPIPESDYVQIASGDPKSLSLWFNGWSQILTSHMRDENIFSFRVVYKVAIFTRVDLI